MTSVRCQPKRSHRARYRQIAQVLGRHGPAYLVSVVKLERVLRIALEELGPTFIKLGPGPVDASGLAAAGIPGGAGQALPAPSQ